MTLTKEYIQHLYKTFKHQAEKCLMNRRYDSCLKFLKAACHTAYTFYIGFRDDEIESILERISQTIQKKDKIETTNRFVFYDTFSQDAQGLTIQYVDAIIAAGWEFLYITEFGLDDTRSVLLKQTLLTYPKARIVTISPTNKGMKKVRLVYDTIMQYAPGKLFMHIHPSAVEAVTAFYALPKEIVKYQINLTDHGYWVGSGCMDYVFDFRDYGASLSAEKRGFSPKQILLLPYYPMMKQTKFKGFPKEAEGKVIILAGASYYKIIDTDDTFFKLNKAILDANHEAVTLFAGGGDKEVLMNLISKYGLQGRFIPIGQRDDIFECYKHADIYLNSFPLFGGLMAQMAAHAGIPILSFARKDSGLVEEVVCQKTKASISFYDQDKFVEEAMRLVSDINYRKARGRLMNSCVISLDEFNRSFNDSVVTGESQYPIFFEDKVKQHYLNVEEKLKLENRTNDYQRYVFAKLGIDILFVCPKIWMNGLIARVNNSRIRLSLRNTIFSK